MQFKKKARTMPLRRSASVASLDSRGVSGRSYRRFYSAVALLVVYSSCMYVSVDQGISRSLSEPMIRKSSSYVTQQLHGLDQPRINLAVATSPASHTENSQSAPSTKPRLFLHVGPQKTGSSTLQSMLDKLSGLTESLSGDNLYFRHIMPEAGDFDCKMDDWGGWHKCVPSEQLTSFIDKAKVDGVNLLLTDENLDQNFVRGLRDVIHDEDWDVTVIVMYRRIHEWLFSWYNQIHKTTNLDSEGNVLFRDGIPYRTEHTQWPDQGGVHVPTFREFYNDYTQYWDPSELTKKHRSIEYYNLYKEAFDTVLLYDMHQEGSMVTDFICNILGADHSCERIQNHEIEIEKINFSVNLDLDILSVSAYEKGLVSKSLSRKRVVETVTNYIRDSNRTLPRNCDSKMTEQIRDWLVETEKIMVGESEWSNNKESKLKEVYENFVAKGKMCDIDLQAVLADEEWIRFFKSMGDFEKGNIVLHVGPIGGNVIHDALATLSGTHHVLQKDNYTMIEMEGHFDCTDQQCEAMDELKSMLSSRMGTGANIVFANDNLDERYAKAFQKAIDQDKWNVKVVVGHIRLDQFLLAMYENEYKTEHLESNVEDLYSKWPDQGGAIIPDFNEWFNAFSEEYNAKNIQELLGTKTRDAFVSSFQNVDYSAYHPQTNRMVTNFACQMLPKAKNTCNLSKSETKTASLLDDYAEADILAVGARARGLLGAGVSRDALREDIRTKLMTSPKVLSRICVSGVTKQLYDWMIENERAMLGDRFTSKRIAMINQEYQQLLKSGKLCALDVQNELLDEVWISFFREYDSSGLEQLAQ